jgi:hypothetical protein
MATQSQVTNMTSATVAEVIIPTGETLENLHDVLGFAQRFRSVFDEINMWREPINKLKSDFGVRQGCAGKRMQIGEKTYDWDEFCRHFFNLSPRRVNELLEEPRPEITDDDLPEFGDNHDEDAESEEAEDEEEGEAEKAQPKPRNKRSKNPRLHAPTANRAIKADFADRLIPVITNRPPEITKEQAYDLLLEMCVLWCEDHADLAAKFRVPSRLEFKTKMERQRKQIQFQRDQIIKLGQEKGELRRELAALRGAVPSPDYPIVTEGTTHKLASLVLEPPTEEVNNEQHDAGIHRKNPQSFEYFYRYCELCKQEAVTDYMVDVVVRSVTCDEWDNPVDSEVVDEQIVKIFLTEEAARKWQIELVKVLNARSGN